METIYNDILDIYFKECLLKNVQFFFDNKLIEEGKLITYHQDMYNVCFILNTKKEDNDEFYLPIPFKIEQEESSVYFDYRIKTFSKNNDELYRLLIEVIRKYKPSKYLNKIVEIQVK